MIYLIPAGLILWLCCDRIARAWELSSKRALEAVEIKARLEKDLLSMRWARQEWVVKMTTNSKCLENV